jgi:CDP-glycerol glycerophosphotransferase
MPKLTFVLAVYREQAYLRECAASILDQDGADVELIAIDDASPDHAPELLDELAERDPRVQVRHLESRAGAGEARNLGLEAASGDYVWFLNTTDRLPAGALAPVAKRLDNLTPDVLLVDHTRTGPFGRRHASPHKKLVAGIAARGVKPLSGHPGAARTAPTAWNKVFRRGLLEDTGARFGRGARHGELALTWPALLAAERIGAASGACYDRRTPPNAVQDDSPFDVFPAYDAVFDFLATRDDVPDARRCLVLPAMLRHELSLLDKLEGDERREFFERMSEAYGRHRRGDEPHLEGREERAREALVARGAYRAFGLLERTQARRAAKKEPPKEKREETDAQKRYRKLRDKPIDPDLAVFAAFWYRGYLDNPRAIYEKARELMPGMRGVWVVKEEGAEAMPPGVDYVVPGTPEYWELLARARFFVNNVNFPNHLVKRDGTVHVMTHHGTPLKRMGLDLQEAKRERKQTDFAALLRRCMRWDYSISSNAFSTLVWERAYPVPCETLEVGYPRNDVLATATDHDVERARAALGIEPGRRAVLYAPTHREYEEKWVPRLDLAQLADALGDEFVIMARLHYFYDSDPALQRLHEQGRIRDVARHPSVEELQIAADALVTDYSSIMFDYAVLDRPIAIHAPDWETYRSKRGTYFDLMAEPPGPVARTGEELVEALRGETWGEESRRLRAAFRARFASLDDGHAAERVVRRVWLGEELPPVRDRVQKVAT